MKQVLIIVQLGIILALFAYIGSRKGDDPQIKSHPNRLPLERRYQVFTFDVPRELQFAGESVPLDKPDIRERMDREIHTNIYWNTSTVFLFKRANRWLPQIGPILEENGVPSDFKYLPLVESALRNNSSPKGAVGFWQILKGTGKELGLEINNEVDQRYDPLKSTEAACKYLNLAYKKFGNWTAVAASYNVGVRGLTRRMQQQKVTSFYDLLLNEETSRYVFRILALKEIMENPERYGYDIPSQHLYQYPVLGELVVDESVASLVDLALENGISYMTLKRHNPWLRKNSLTIKRSGKSYVIKIPKDPVNRIDVDMLFGDSSLVSDDSTEFRISDPSAQEFL